MFTITKGKTFSHFVESFTTVWLSIEKYCNDIGIIFKFPNKNLKCNFCQMLIFVVAEFFGF